MLYLYYMPPMPKLVPESLAKDYGKIDGGKSNRKWNLNQKKQFKKERPGRNNLNNSVIQCVGEISCTQWDTERMVDNELIGTLQYSTVK